LRRFFDGHCQSFILVCAALFLAANMAAAQFSDDAYNKNINEMGDTGGTLIGNWFEERVLRDACGEGRSVPQRHLRRSGLLQDFTKMPSGGPRKMDNTFDRMYGPKQNVKHVPFSKQIGGGEDDIFGDRPIAETLQAAGRIPRQGAKEITSRQARLEAAEEAVQEEEAIVDKLANERYFETTTGRHFERPLESQSQRAEHLRQSFKLELLHGPAPDRKLALANEGIEVPAHVHYSNLEAPTHGRMSMADPRMRSDMQSSAAGGVNMFGKHSEFTKPVGECLLGLSKDEELDTMYQGLKQSNPFRTLGSAKPRGPNFGAVPSLASLKENIHRQIGEIWGPQGYVVLRQRLFDCSDEEGFVKKGSVLAVLREQLQLSPADVGDAELSVYLAQLITMKKDELHVGALMSSLRPPLPLKVRRQVIDTFEALEPVDGAVRLGPWLDRIPDPTLRDTITAAFGAEGDPDVVRDMPVTEAVFLELLSDLAPFADLSVLL